MCSQSGPARDVERRSRHMLRRSGRESAFREPLGALQRHCTTARNDAGVRIARRRFDIVGSRHWTGSPGTKSGLPDPQWSGAHEQSGVGSVSSTPFRTPLGLQRRAAPSCRLRWIRQRLPSWRSAPAMLPSVASSNSIPSCSAMLRRRSKPTRSDGIPASISSAVLRISAPRVEEGWGMGRSMPVFLGCVQTSTTKREHGSPVISAGRPGSTSATLRGPPACRSGCRLRHSRHRSLRGNTANNRGFSIRLAEQRLQFPWMVTPVAPQFRVERCSRPLALRAPIFNWRAPPRRAS